MTQSATAFSDDGRSLSYNGLKVGYCTNVHAGTDLDTIQDNLIRYAVPAREAAQCDILPIGLWLPSTAARELDGCADSMKSFLREHRLAAYTINGFPYDRFHKPVVKHDVYRPTWAQPPRLEYTTTLARVLATLLPDEDRFGTISTLPIGWPSGNAADDDVTLAAAGKQLRTLCDRLADLESTTGKRIVVAIEPEPGCLLDSTAEVIEFFESQLPETTHRRYLGVCHDVCHAAVMMEDQTDVLNQFAKADIVIGKVQVSAAIDARWEAMAVRRRREAIEQLALFAEDRYLHQTGRKNNAGRFELAEDLPELIRSAAVDGDPVRGDKQWIVHFHVPIFLDRFGHLATTNPQIRDVVETLSHGKNDFSGHFEIETYAWSVLPAAMRRRGLAEDIASELRWFDELLNRCW